MYRFLCCRRDHYFTSATWISTTEISVVWLNRPQNISVVTICKSPMWICQEVSVWVVRVPGYLWNNLVPSIRHIASVATVKDGWTCLRCHISQQMAARTFPFHRYVTEWRVCFGTWFTCTYRRSEFYRWHMAHSKWIKSSIGMSSIILCKFLGNTHLWFWIWFNESLIISNRYFIGTPENAPGQQHLYRVSSLPPKFGVALTNPQCLTCTKLLDEALATTTGQPPRLATSWEDEWEAEPTSPPTTTAAPRRKRKKGELHFCHSE